MSAPSLASEIAQLHELFKLGALTEEEFNSAKQATLQAFLSKSGTSTSAATSSPTVASQQNAPASSSLAASPLIENAQLASSDATDSATTSVTSSPPSLRPALTTATAPAAATAAPTRTRAEWLRLWSTSPVHTPSGLTTATNAVTVDAVDLRVQALRCAARLFRNVQASPAEPKYRRLREANRVIALELLPVEASAALLRLGGFTRQAEEEKEGGGRTVSTADAAQAAAGNTNAPTSFVWVQSDEPAEAARKAAVAVRVVEHLLEGMGEQQSRRLGLLQLWRSVALEVRLERAAREAAATPGGPLMEAQDAEEEKEEEETASASLHPFLDFMVESYSLDEAGDGLYSAQQHLQTLLDLYTAAAAAAAQQPVNASSVTSHALLGTAELYGAVVQQRGAVELLLHGCGAQLHPAPSPTAQPAQSSAETAFANDLYVLELLPATVQDGPAHAERCVRFLRRLQDRVNRVRQQRAAAARAAAEKSMRQELRRERQRQQLEQGRVRGEVEQGSQLPLRRPRRGSSSSSDSSAAATAHSGTAEGRRRIPIAEALAVLMGKRSPPLTRPPAASSSSLSPPK